MICINKMSLINASGPKIKSLKNAPHFFLILLLNHIYVIFSTKYTEVLLVFNKKYNPFLIINTNFIRNYYFILSSLLLLSEKTIQFSYFLC